MVSLYTKLKSRASADGGQNGLYSGLIWTINLNTFVDANDIQKLLIERKEKLQREAHFRQKGMPDLEADHCLLENSFRIRLSEVSVIPR